MGAGLSSSRAHLFLIHQLTITNKFKEVYLAQVKIEVEEGNLLFGTLEVDVRSRHHLMGKLARLLLHLLTGKEGGVQGVHVLLELFFQLFLNFILPLLVDFYSIRTLNRRLSFTFIMVEVDLEKKTW